MPSDDESSRRIAALETTVARLEQELAASKASHQRAAVQQALIDHRLLILERNRLFRWWGQAYRAAARLYTRFSSDNRPDKLTADLRTPGDYARWVSHEQHRIAKENHPQILAQWRSQPLISVLMTAGSKVRDADCLASLQSLINQCYPHWELCLASASPVIRGEVERRQTALRIRMVDQATAEAAAGEFILVLHPGDQLSPHALYYYAQALQEDPPDMLYADEDRLDANGARAQPLFKPGWSPELLSSVMYLGRAVLYRRGSDWKYGRHIPQVLYHRSAATAVSLQRSIPHYAPPPDSRLSVVICSKNIPRVRECLAAIKSSSTVPLEILLVHHTESETAEDIPGCISIPYRGPFNFAHMNNLAASRATAPYLVFLNDDVIFPAAARAQQAGWDEAFAATLARPEIAIAGAILHYPDGTLQHAGVVAGMGDAVGHCGRFQMSSDLWPWLRMSRDVTAVTGALLGIRTALFRQMGGFDETFPVNYNDVDLCFRAREAGLRVVCLDLGKIIHREAQTRLAGTSYQEREALYKKWAHLLAQPDPFYSVHLAPTERIALNSTGPSPLVDL